MPYLEFKGRKFVENYHHTVGHHSFEFDPKLSVLPSSEPPSLEGNLLIEGDNLKALKSLLPTHAGRIRCVYIDPPYNTGNEGWVYNDNLTQPQFKDWIGRTVGNESEDATRHDKWCCMMLPRLRLIKDLLTTDGSVFISIDDNESHHLRCLCGEVFGENNFIANVIWQKVYSPKSSARHLSESHDHILIYAKDANVWRPKLLARNEEQDSRYKNLDDDPRGPWKPSDLSARNFYGAGTYPITTPSGRIIPGPPKGNYWRYSEERLKQLDLEGRIWWGKEGNNVPAIKRFLSDVKDGIVPQTIWPYDVVGHTQEAKRELLTLLPDADEVFVTPKPTRLIRRILELATNQDDVILDCTAGSGTTAHAILQVNSDEDSFRRFILTQQAHDTKDDEKNQVNICCDITRERIKRVIEGKNTPALGGSFTYARLSDAPVMGTYRDLDPLPSYEDLARTVFYTHTSQSTDETQWNRESGFLGEKNGASIYLLYDPDADIELGLERDWLDTWGKRDPNFSLVIYSEKFAIHRDDLREWCEKHGKTVTHLLVPYEIK